MIKTIKMVKTLATRSLPGALALLLACDGTSSAPPSAPSPASQPAESPAKPGTKPGAPLVDPAPPRPATPTTPKEDEHPGFADPKTVDTPPPAPPQVPVDAALAARITRKFGELCKHERSCGDLLGIDCQSAADGPYYYARRSDLKTVATCGGACMSGSCTDCPPKAWTCPTY